MSHNIFKKLLLMMHHSSPDKIASIYSNHFVSIFCHFLDATRTAFTSIRPVIQNYAFKKSIDVL
jgi:hypothetical protein